MTTDAPVKQTWMRRLMGLAVFLVITGGIWIWFFCRFYVPPDYMAIVTAKTGASLEPGKLLAGPGQKGIQEMPLPEGRYFLNPMTHDWRIVPILTIPPGKAGIVTSKVGSDLPVGEFLADDGQKGIWRKALGPGKYRLNPMGYHIELIDAISIPIGYVGVVTSLSGTQISEGAFAGPNQKGIRREVLQPGLYYMNPFEFKTDVLEVGLNQVSLTGMDGGEVLTKGQMETQNVAMQELATSALQRQQEKRLDYIEKQEAKSDAVSRRAAGAQAPPAVGAKDKKAPKHADGAKPAAPQRTKVSNETLVTASLVPYVEFPSRDGFEIRLDMTVEFEFLPSRIAEIFKNYGDLPAVVDKIIMPQILSISRLKGSNYGAKEFIVGEGREQFQNELTDALAQVLGEKKIEVHNALIRHVSVPEDILRPIQLTALAVEQDLTNRERQNTARMLAELNTVESLVDQRRQEVLQETAKMTAEIMAAQEREVAEIQAETNRQVASIRQDTATVQAQTTRQLGEARAQATRFVQGEKARGFQMRVQAMGDAEAFTQLDVAEKLNPDIRVTILHAGEGTLWTDLKNPRLSDLGAGVQLGPAAIGPQNKQP
ncbi:MAG: SPFH domain-containing protein [Desulfatirhabdiaceae bacterium]